MLSDTWYVQSRSHSRGFSPEGTDASNFIEGWVRNRVVFTKRGTVNYERRS